MYNYVGNVSLPWVTTHMAKFPAMSALKFLFSLTITVK